MSADLAARATITDSCNSGSTSEAPASAQGQSVYTLRSLSVSNHMSKGGHGLMAN